MLFTDADPSPPRKNPGQDGELPSQTRAFEPWKCDDRLLCDLWNVCHGVVSFAGPLDGGQDLPSGLAGETSRVFQTTGVGANE